jgi:hypothetical protein
MTTALCAMAPMVEARRDGRLDAREAASIERHIAGCASCRAFEAQLGRLAELSRHPLRVELSELEHQRGRAALLRAAASETGGAERAAPSGARRPRLVIAATLAAAALSLLGAVASEWGPAPAPRPVALALKLPRPPALQREIARAEATVTAASGTGDARFERSVVGGLDSVERVELFEGAIDLEVPKLAPRARFLVTTDDAEVEVRGTRFRVEAHHSHIAAVAVTEGKVEVRYQGASTMLLPGMSWTPSAPSQPSAALATSAGPREGAPPALRTPGVAAPRRAAPHGLPASSASAGARPASAFAEGVRLIERGDYAAAADKLEAFSAATPGDERAEDAAFLAVVALQRAGRLDAAAAAARRYLDRYPRARRRAEAEAIAAEH